MSFSNIEEKLSLIERNSSGGYCAIKLLILLPSFGTCSLDDFRVLIEKTKEDCGKYGPAHEVMMTIGVGEFRLRNASDGGSVLDDNFKPNDDIFKLMCESKSRFSIQDDLQLIHIDTYIFDQCEHDGIVCNHGLSARAAVTLIGGSSKRVGGTVIDMNELFGDFDDKISDSTVTGSKIKPSNQERVAVDKMLDRGMSREPPEIHDYSRKFGQRRDSAFEEEQDLHAETIIQQHETINRLQNRLNSRKSGASVNSESVLADLQDKVSALTELLGQKSKKPQESSESELDPDDSRSNLDTLNNRYMRQGTVLTMRNRGGTVLQDIVEIPPLAVNTDVVVGYIKTKEMSSREHETNMKIRPINGLSKPFRDNRLNLLLHFNTAVTTNMPVNNERGYAESLSRISRYKSKTPSEELAKQMIQNTFDFEEQTVFANPFKLPFVEVGMSISDNCLAACFSLLDDELQRLWFESMKSVKVPDFHSRFSGFGESNISGQSREKHSFSDRNKRTRRGTSEITVESRSSRSKQSSGWFR
jgi:hypothetical protein